MNTIRLTKEFNFEMAHALFGYDGACKNIHGHSYKLSVTIKGEPIKDENNPKLGMVMDFTELKNIVKPIIDELDHATMLSANSPHKKLAEKNALFEKLVLVNYQPTCENILIDMADYIKRRLRENISLHHLKLQETPTSYAEWFAEDN
jgi:6-pyruvoyltetrahydropterin/6-carboxytetrahydropterin synthase